MKKTEKKTEKKTSRENLVELLVKEIPNMFDNVPRGVINRGAVEKLVEKINK